MFFVYIPNFFKQKTAKLLEMRGFKLLWGENKEYERVQKNCLIHNNFKIVKGIGVKTQASLYEQGIKHWLEVENFEKPGNFTNKKWNQLKMHIQRAYDSLKCLDKEQIHQLIPKKFHWQLIPYFIGKIAYLDIETTGLYYTRSHITTIAVYDGEDVYEFIYDDNLDEFKEFIEKYPAVATFNGKTFDVPFIEYELGMKMDHIHFDLRWLLKKIGLKGGLKKIEKRIGIERPESEGVDGYAAVLLWKKYEKTKDKKYLETLLAYNIEDVLNLEYLLHQAYNHLAFREDESIPLLDLPKCSVENPFHADKNIVSEIMTEI